MRFRSLLWLCLAVPAFSYAGCSCDPSDVGDATPDGGPTCPGASCIVDGAEVCSPDVSGDLCPSSLIGYDLGICPPGAEVYDCTSLTWGCGDAFGSSCIPPNEPGYLAQYLDSVSVADGAGGEYVAISGYSPGWLDSGNIVWPYGDLVYAEYATGDDEVVTYTIIDGKPADTVDNVQRSPMAWRGGNMEPGDDVGKYSSITASAAGDIYIAYSDFTPGARKLKLARRAAGSTTFTITVVDDSTLLQTGGAFYPSIAMSNGVPVIAYGVREAAASAGTQPHGWVRVATAASATPTGSTDWTTVDMVEAISDIGCVEGDSLCASGDRCAVAGTSGRGICVTPSTACIPATAGGPLCPAGQFGTVTICADVDGTAGCVNLKGGGDLVDAQGLFNQLVPVGTDGSLALAYHDRSAGQHTGTGCETDAGCDPLAFCSGATITDPADNDGECIVPNGNLWGARRDATNVWAPRFLIDGYSRRVPTVGDCGQHASLLVDANGVWHVAYLDGTFDRIRYAQVAAAATSASNFSFVDDGTAEPLTRPLDRADGRRRLVGGDISMSVSAAGELRILYQDMTGPENPDPLLVPTGVQPLIAVRNAVDVLLPWNIRVPATDAPNSGWWTTQSVGAVNAGQSYCIWAQRTANVNDPDAFPDDDGAETHVLECEAD